MNQGAGLPELQPVLAFMSRPSSEPCCWHLTSAFSVNRDVPQPLPQSPTLLREERGLSG